MLAAWARWGGLRSRAVRVSAGARGGTPKRARAGGSRFPPRRPRPPAGLPWGGAGGPRAPPPSPLPPPPLLGRPGAAPGGEAGGGAAPQGARGAADSLAAPPARLRPLAVRRVKG